MVVLSDSAHNFFLKFGWRFSLFVLRDANTQTNLGLFQQTRLATQLALQYCSNYHDHFVKSILRAHDQKRQLHHFVVWNNFFVRIHDSFRRRISDVSSRWWWSSVRWSTVSLCFFNNHHLLLVVVTMESRATCETKNVFFFLNVGANPSRLLAVARWCVTFVSWFTVHVTLFFVWLCQVFVCFPWQDSII